MFFHEGMYFSSSNFFGFFFVCCCKWRFGFFSFFITLFFSYDINTNSVIDGDPNLRRPSLLPMFDTAAVGVPKAGTEYKRTMNAGWSVQYGTYSPYGNLIAGALDVVVELWDAATGNIPLDSPRSHQVC